MTGNATVERRPLEVTQEVMGSLFEYLQRVKRMKAEGRPVLVAPLSMPYEIFRAMDVPVVPLDNLPGIAATLGTSARYCEIAEAEGLSRDTCSFSRCFVGLVHAGEAMDAAMESLYAAPDLIVGASCFCSSQNKAFLHAARHLDVPYFVFDGPVNCWGGELPDHVVGYYVRQFQEMIAFLEGFGFRMDWARLGEEIETTRRALAVEREIAGYAGHVPAPAGGIDVCFSPIVAVHLEGRKALPLLEKKRDELRERVEKGIGVIDGERLRLMWFISPPLYRFQLLHHAEKDGAVVVTTWVDPIFVGFDPAVLDPGRPLESLARKLLTRCDSPTFELFPEAVVRVVRELQIDGVVAAMQRSCALVPAQMRRIKDRVLAETGVPTLLVDADYGDDREFDETGITSSLDSFVATLLAARDG